MITAKVTVHSRLETGVGDQRQVQVEFNANYNAGRNKEWSLYTPALLLKISLKGEVADRFMVGQAYTLTFEESDS